MADEPLESSELADDGQAVEQPETAPERQPCVTAAIVPYQGGYCGIAIVAPTESGGYELVDAHSILASHLDDIPPEERVSSKDKRRVVSDADLDALWVDVELLLNQHGVERVLLESPSMKSNTAVVVARGLNDRLTAFGLGPEYKPSTWRLGFGEDGSTQRGECRSVVAANLGNEGLLQYDSIVYAATLSVHVLFGVGLERTYYLGPKAGAEPRERKGRAFDPEARTIVTETGSRVSGATERHDETTQAPVTGQIRAGIDSGSRALALAIAQGDTWPVQLRYLHTFDVGEIVPLPKPRIVKHALGGSHTITTKRVVNREHISKLANQVVEQMASRGVTSVVMEFSDSAHFSRAGSKATEHSAIATNLLKQLWLAVTITERAEARGIRVQLVAPVTWRAKVTRRSTTGDGAELIPMSLKQGYRNWPLASNEHERDAGGALLYGCLPEDIEKRPRPKKVGDKVILVREKRKTKEQERKEELLRRKAEVGCKCKRKHDYSCPLSKHYRGFPSTARTQNV